MQDDHKKADGDIDNHSKAVNIRNKNIKIAGKIISNGFDMSEDDKINSEGDEVMGEEKTIYEEKRDLEGSSLESYLEE